MSRPALNVTNNLSIAWGMVLALVTILDWRSVERNPLEAEIFTPFISRQVTMSLLSPEQRQLSIDSIDGEQGPPVQYNVELSFNGPLFLLYFFGPVAGLFIVGKLIGNRNQIKPKT